MTLSCLCGAVTLAVRERPAFIHECNCTLCRKSGARWSYVDPATVEIAGATTGYRRDDKATPAAETHSCATCGATTHFVLTEAVVAEHGNTMMGINMQLAEHADLAGMELRFPDGAAWSGAGEFGFVRDPVAL